VTPPEEYLDLVLIPAMLHIDPLTFMDYPPALAYKLRGLVLHYIATGGMAHGG
jgi:hypothetical protein